MKLSVVTCTLNPAAHRYGRVLDGLRAQTLPVTEWEYLVVDNGSDEAIAARFDLTWHPQARVVVEPEKGLTRARLKGFAEARGDIVVFDDDDVVLQADYLEKVVDYFVRHPFLGVVGGCGPAEYEAAYPDWMKTFLGMVMDEAFTPNPKAPFQYAMAKQGGPWIPAGSAMAVRRDIALHYAGVVRGDPFRLDLDRKGQGIAGAGDTDLAYTAMDLGWASGTALDLRFTHLIPAHRLEPRYMERLLYSTNYYSAKILLHRGWKKPVPAGRPTWRNRLAEALNLRARKPWPERCWIAYARGYRDGTADRPFDPFYA